MLLAIGPGGRYLIIAMVILVVVAGGVFLAYRMSTRSSDPTTDEGAPGARPDDAP